MSPTRTTEYTPRHAEPERADRPAISRNGDHLVIDLDAPRPQSPGSPTAPPAAEPATPRPAPARRTAVPALTGRAFEYFGTPDPHVWGSDPTPQREAVWLPGDPVERPVRHPGWRPPAAPSPAARRSSTWWRRR